jgi:hypothetical protein
MKRQQLEESDGVVRKGHINVNFEKGRYKQHNSPLALVE